MPPNTKIATCCYCGTRAALVLKGTERHELACSACGAPLHDLKALKPRTQRRGERELVGPSRTRRSLPERAPPGPGRAPKQQWKSRKKKRKSPMKKVLSEAFDLLEDIFD